MAKALDKQVYIYSVSTEAFYTEKETEIHNKLSKQRILKKSLQNKIHTLNNQIIDASNDALKNSYTDRIDKLMTARNKLSKYINKEKNRLIKMLNENKEIRNLRDDALQINKKIGLFDSALTRTLGIKIDSVSTDIIVVRVYYYQVLESLISDGFHYNGEKYIYFSSSAGQIRTKKGVWIKESLWKKHKGALTCGLDIDEINKKGGCNTNKLLAYKALTASASVKWTDFDIERTIVVPDLETDVSSLFDHIDMDTYDITRKMLSVSIEHTDGCGMILPKKSKKAFMVRLPYVKGLLVPFPFDKFSSSCKNSKVIDIYGKEWDIIKDDIHVIFTASQFKMKKYYDDWYDYKTRFKENNCQAVKLNEEDIGENANLNYQMLQTLTNITSKELKELAKPTSDDISKVGSDKETMLRILGATKSNKKRNYYQEALYLYPELLNDEHSKKIIKDKKKSMVRDARAGKLRINGKYTYLVPDLYAFCERLFEKKENPNGLLDNGTVYCDIYDEGKLDILRSPHLYKEHCVRLNSKDEEKAKWFITNGIYTSIHDPISRILQFDNDGDKALVIQDEPFVRIAERNMEDIVPLYYEMGTSDDELITDKRIYDSLLLAFKANIGEVSNNITKVLNNEDIDLRVVKWLTAENNYIIDYAKTLYMPRRPEWVDEIVKNYIKSKVPHFFIEAKDKEKKNVEPINKSTVNRLRKIIPNKRIKFEEIAGEFDYKVLMSEEVVRVDREVVNKYRELERNKKWLIQSTSKIKKEGKMYVDKYIREELLKVNSDVIRVANILIEELYGRTNSKNKTTLWDSFGDILLNNLRENIKGTKQCRICGKRIEVVNNKVKYCSDCAVEINRSKTKERMKINRKKV
ncbi:hypothetical protein [Lederbergia lenta]|uniref:hypothetical protein n=1 Tax=Lederbergia lenta TaxID=1467 RepID=UPI00204045CE|nr:hypothetical protein [Lederbergia lenta]MCM3110016.1 hypothetical protein [Lederbergia lenta]